MTDPTRPRSTFVTVVAGLFLGFNAFACMISIGQNLMLHLLFPLEEMKARIGEFEQMKHVPRIFVHLFQHLEWFVGGFLVLSVLQVILAVGLLKRRNWARLIFIAWMGLAAVGSLGGIFGQHALLEAFPPIPTDAPPEFQQHFAAFMRTFKIMSVVMGVGFAALFGWIGWRLSTSRFAAEFR